MIGKCFAGLLFALACISHPHSAAAQAAVFVHFECATENGARIVARMIDTLTPQHSGLPAGCDWTSGERMANIVQVMPQYIETSNGEIIWIARVERYGKPSKYSAGRLVLLLS